MVGRVNGSVDGDDRRPNNHPAKESSSLHRTTDAPVLRRAHGREEDQGERVGELQRVLLLGEARGVEGRVRVIFIVGECGEEVAPELERAGEVGLLWWWAGGVG